MQKLLLLIILFFSTNILPRTTIEYSLTNFIVPTIISGTLEPFVLAIDGREFLKRNDKIFKIFVNGSEVKVNADEHKSYFNQLNSNEIKIEIENEKEKLLIGTYNLPEAKVTVNNSVLEISLIGNVDEIYIDKIHSNIKKGKVEFEIPKSDPVWFEEVHVIELKKKDSIGRFYNFNILRKEIVLPDLSNNFISYGNSSDTISGFNPKVRTIGYMRIFYDKYPQTINYKWGSRSSSYTYTSDKMELQAVEFRSGRIFFNNGKIFEIFRFDVGLGFQIINAVYDKMYYYTVNNSTRYENNSETTRNNYVQFGPYFRYMPIMWKFIGAMGEFKYYFINNGGIGIHGVYGLYIYW